MITPNKKFKEKIYIPVVLSGGVGGRLWPASREGHPKPFIKLLDGKTLLEKTYNRIKNISNILKVDEKPFILTVTNKDYYFLCKEELDNANLSGMFLLEPEGRNTAPAISIAAHWVKQFYGEDAIMLVFPADHLIEETSKFLSCIKEMQSILLNSPPSIVTFGISPKSADTGFGYLQIGAPISSGFKVKKFVEKPNISKAQNYLKSKDFFWNSGILGFRVNIFFEELKDYAYEIYDSTKHVFQEALKVNKSQNKVIYLPDESFKKCIDLSIDFLLLEKSKKLVLIPSTFDWNDIGSWLNYSNLVSPDKDHNKKIGNGIFLKSHNTFINSQGRLVAAIGLRDIMIIDTDDALLVINSAHSQDVKQLREEIKDKNQGIVQSHSTSVRPWGKYKVLQKGNSFKIKSIEVNPLQSLSLQSHKHRSEHWVVIEGEAEVVNGNKKYKVKTNESTFIAQGSKHRLSNPSKDKKLVIIEVQSGPYVEEDDIERFEDDFGRL